MLIEDERNLYDACRKNCTAYELDVDNADEYGTHPFDVTRLLDTIDRLAAELASARSDETVLTRAGEIMMKDFVSFVTLQKRTPSDRFVVRHVDVNLEADGKTLAEAVAKLKGGA